MSGETNEYSAKMMTRVQPSVRANYDANVLSLGLDCQKQKQSKNVLLVVSFTWLEKRILKYKIWKTAKKIACRLLFFPASLSSAGVFCSGSELYKGKADTKIIKRFEFSLPLGNHTNHSYIFTPFSLLCNTYSVNQHRNCYRIMFPLIFISLSICM